FPLGPDGEPDRRDGADGKHAILLIAIVAAHELHFGDLRDALHLLDLGLVAIGHRLEVARIHEHSIELLPADDIAECRVQSLQQTEEDECDDDREESEERTRRLAPQTCPDKGQILHQGVASAVSTIRPCASRRESILNFWRSAVSSPSTSPA